MPQNESSNLVKCDACNTMVAESVISKTRGFCYSCRDDIALLTKAIEESNFEPVWQWFVSRKKRRRHNNEEGKKKFEAFAERFVDKRFKAEHDSAPKLDYFVNELARIVPAHLEGTIDTTDSSNVDAAYALARCERSTDSLICPTISFPCRVDQIPLMPAVGAPFPILHQMVIDEISSTLRREIEFIPCPVVARDGPSAEYFAANVLHSFCIWDLERSFWKPLSKNDAEPFFMRLMKVKEGLSIDCSVFRNRDWLPQVVYSATIADILSRLAPEWFMKRPVDGWGNH